VATRSAAADDAAGAPTDGTVATVGRTGVTAATRRRVERSMAGLSRSAATRMDETLPWYRALSAEDRSWVGLVAQAGIGRSQRALAQEEFRREPLDRVAHDAGRVERLDLAVGTHRQRGQRTPHRQRIECIAESIFAHAPVTIRLDIHAPIDDVLAFMIARFDPQMLED